MYIQNSTLRKNRVFVLGLTQAQAEKLVGQHAPARFSGKRMTAPAAYFVWTRAKDGTHIVETEYSGDEVRRMLA